MNSDSLFHNLYPWWYDIVSSYKIPIGVVLGFALIYLFFRHLDDLRVFKANVSKLLTFLGDAPSKYYIANDIKARLGRVLANSEFKDHFEIFDVKIKWVDKNTSREVFVSKYKMVVKLENSKSQDKNFAVATHLTVCGGFLANEKLYLDYPIRSAIELITTKEILRKEKGNGAVSIFNREILDPALEKNPPVRVVYPLIERLQLAGFLLNIFYLELRTLRNRYYPDLIGNIEIQQELIKFLGFLDDIATKEIGIKINLEFCGRYIQAHVILMAIKEKVRYSIEPYLGAVRIGIKNGYSNFYIIAYQHCILAIDKVAKEASKYGCKTLDDFGIYRGQISGLAQELRCIHLVGGMIESPQLDFDVIERPK